MKTRTKQDLFFPCIFIYNANGPLSILSNYSITPFKKKGVLWNSVEHFYQAHKFKKQEHIDLVRMAPSPQLAKNIAWGELNTFVRKDWDSIRVNIMQEAINLKFTQCKNAYGSLLSTWPLLIAEDSKDDYFWGIGADCSGKNMLGVILSDLRDNNLNAHSPFLSGKLLTKPLAEKSYIRWAHLQGVEIKNDILITPPSLYFSNFCQISIEQLAQIPTKSLDKFLTTDFKSISRAFEVKYGEYMWSQDVRSMYPNWVDSFYGVLASVKPSIFLKGKLFAIGAGAGNESAYLWDHFKSSVTLCDIGKKLVTNICREAPMAKVCMHRAEDLSSVPNNTYECYCALRTYESMYFDINKSLSEAKRILKNDGVFVISISNGYMTDDFSLIHGQFSETGKISLLLPWLLLIKIINQSLNLGATKLRIENLQTEICIIGKFKKN